MRASTIVLLCAFLIVSLTLTAPSAKAQDGYGRDGEWNWDWSGIGTGDPHRRWHRTYHRRHYHPPVYAYEQRDHDQNDRHGDRDRHGDDAGCKDRVRGLGTQWIGTKGALEAAKKDWMERVRYDHGEKYIDLMNARGFESTCGRVSIGEVAGQVTYRCEMFARPCKGTQKDADGHNDRREDRR